MTTILILQMRNLRFKYFPKFTLLVLAELVCSNSDPLASTPHHPVPKLPCLPSPSSRAQQRLWWTLWARYCFLGQAPTQSYFPGLEKK